MKNADQELHYQEMIGELAELKKYSEWVWEKNLDKLLNKLIRWEEPQPVLDYRLFVETKPTYTLDYRTFN